LKNSAISISYKFGMSVAIRKTMKKHIDGKTNSRFDERRKGKR